MPITIASRVLRSDATMRSLWSVPVGDLYALRNLLSDFAQFRFDSAGDFDRVSGRLLVNLEKNGIMAVGRYANPLRLGRMFNRGHVVEQDYAVRQSTAARFARFGRTF